MHEAIWSRSRPLQVYLDSSDYSDFSRDREFQPASDLQVLDFLSAAVRKQQIQIRYSIVHVIEACHRDGPSKSHAVARVRTIHELSNLCVMKPPLAVISGECREASAGESGADIPFDDDGRWYPDPGNLGKEMRSNLRPMIEAAIREKGANRAARRFARRRLAKNSRHLALVQAVSRDSDGWQHACLMNGIPARVATDGLFRKMFDGQVTDSELTELICMEVFQVVNFVADYLDNFEKTGEIRGAARNLGAKLVKSVEELLGMLGDLRMYVDRDVAAEISDLKRDYAARIAILRDELLTRALDGESSDHIRMECAGIDALVTYVESWFLDVVGGFTSAGRKPKISDGGDAFHAFYMPYVDVWRGDKYSAPVLADKARQYNTVVAKRRSELPEVLLALFSKPLKP
jgi:hypothetical protein